LPVIRWRILTVNFLSADSWTYSKHTTLPISDDKSPYLEGKNHAELFLRSECCFCVRELFDTSYVKVQGSSNLIWKLKIAPKVKNFMWRICRNWLPTRVRLRDKGVTCPMNYTLCMMDIEDTLHLFFQCPSSLNVKSMLPFFSSMSILLQQDMDSKYIIFKALHDLSKEGVTLFWYVLWSIWK